MAAVPLIVTICASGGDVQVITESHGDRERHGNGMTPLTEGVSKHFIVDEDQSIRVIAAPVHAPAEQDLRQAPITDDQPDKHDRAPNPPQ